MELPSSAELSRRGCGPQRLLIISNRGEFLSAIRLLLVDPVRINKLAVKQNFQSVGHIAEVESASAQNPTPANTHERSSSRARLTWSLNSNRTERLIGIVGGPTEK
jgi:hypothetical protein